ncbi:MAG TPA: hypothetical protein PLL10_01115, partial [Elusimicrobiales bacterium]|nr:hypothetical protein [Elusimicrobiales bacterium]
VLVDTLNAELKRIDFEEEIKRDLKSVDMVVRRRVLQAASGLKSPTLLRALEQAASTPENHALLPDIEHAKRAILSNAYTKLYEKAHELAPAECVRLKNILPHLHSEKLLALAFKAFEILQPPLALSILEYVSLHAYEANFAEMLESCFSGQRFSIEPILLAMLSSDGKALELLRDFVKSIAPLRKERYMARDLYRIVSRIADSGASPDQARHLLGFAIGTLLRSENNAQIVMSHLSGNPDDSAIAEEIINSSTHDRIMRRTLHRLVVLVAPQPMPAH